MADLELCYAPAVALARRIRAGELSPVEVVENSLARIDEVNDVLNCFCFVYAEEARARAASAVRAVSSGGRLGPLHGVPIAIKDYTPIRGKRTTFGSKIFEHYVAEEQPAVVSRLLAAGAIIVGKTTTPEFAHSGFTRSPLWGTTGNPWDPTRSSGGSSGGSAAAVASGCVPLAEGSDAGGSVRIPAALSGTVGLKPSLGRIPVGILPTVFDSLFHFGPLALTVADAALFLKVTEGPDDRDPLSQLAPCRLEVPPRADVSGVKLALSIDLGFYAMDSEVATNAQASAEALRDLGAQVQEVDLGWTVELIEAWNAHWVVLLAACYGDYLKDWRNQMDPRLVELINTGLSMSAVDYKRTELVRTRAWRKLATVLTQHDALLTATTARTAPSNCLDDADFQGEDEQGRYQGLYMTQPFNFFGQCPALSVPSGATATGLPTALQIVGRRFDDATVLRIGAALEQTRPWSGRRPDL